MIRYLIAVLALATSTVVHGEIFKCTDGKGRVTYANSPCPASAVQTQTDIPTTGYPESGRDRLGSTGGLATSRQLDEAVRKAIGEGDLQHARALALNDKHRAWIAEAEAKKAPVNGGAGKARTDLRAEMSNSQECQAAKRAYDLEAKSSFSKWQGIESKKQLMWQACGL